MVDVNEIKKAFQKLKEMNWLYEDVREDSVDEAVQEVVERLAALCLRRLPRKTFPTCSATQSEHMNTKQFTDDDILEQYKLMNEQEEPIDSRQKYLDIMCFPTLFPDRNFSQYHDRLKKNSHSEYIKSRLLNKDSCFRKDPRYVFYLYRCLKPTVP